MWKGLRFFWCGDFWMLVIEVSPALSFDEKETATTVSKANDFEWRATITT